MKKYLASIAVLAVAMSLAVSAHAQTAGTQTQTTVPVQGKAKAVNANKILWTVLEKLQVTDEEKTKVKALVKTNQKDLSDLRKSVKAGTTTKEDAKTKQKEIRKSFLESVKAALTPDQAKQFDALLKEETKKAREEAKNGTSTSTTTTTGGTGTTGTSGTKTGG